MAAAAAAAAAVEVEVEVEVADHVASWAEIEELGSQMTEIVARARAGAPPSPPLPITPRPARGIRHQRLTSKSTSARHLLCAPTHRPPLRARRTR